MAIQKPEVNPSTLPKKAYVLLMVVCVAIVVAKLPMESVGAKVKTVVTKITGTAVPRVLEYGYGYDRLPVSRVVHLRVPPIDPEEGYWVWTKWQTRPEKAKRFQYKVSDEIEMEKSFADNSTSGPIVTSPISREWDKKRITGVRFRNFGPDTVLISIEMTW